MIKLGTEKELYKIAHLPINVQNAISEDVKLLDEYYGKNRNVDVDMGGFVVVCDSNEKLNIVNFDKNSDTFESSQVVCPFKRKHYISGTERNIIIYEQHWNMDKYKEKGILLCQSNLVKYRREVDSMEVNSNIKLFNSIYNDISEVFGVDVAIHMYQQYRGLQISFPTRLFNTEYVRKQVPIEYNGNNLKELAKKYGYSEKTIRRMIKEI